MWIFVDLNWEDLFEVFNKFSLNKQYSFLSNVYFLFNRENLLADCLQGCFVVTCTLCAFISLVWLREQIVHGGAPQWLEQNQQQPLNGVGQQNEVRLNCSIVHNKYRKRVSVDKYVIRTSSNFIWLQCIFLNLLRLNMCFYLNMLMSLFSSWRSIKWNGNGFISVSFLLGSFKIV